MLAPDNKEFERAVTTDPDDITIGGLLGFLAAHTDKPLVFFYGGRPVKAGYHVTEVKAGQFAALDCGANPESWSEILSSSGTLTRMKGVCTWLRVSSRR